jgi:tetratricopeptide (TPR) repeat protein
MTVLPVSFLLLAAALVGPVQPPRATIERPFPLPARVGLALMALAAIAVIFAPMASTSAIRKSQAAVRAGNGPEALEQARDAADWQPFAASPKLQEALVLELGGELEAALAAAREATEEEPTNWRHWLLVSRIEAALGRIEESTEAYSEARSLNPRSALFRE